MRQAKKPEPLRYNGALFVFEGRQSKARQATPREIWEAARDLGPVGGKRGRHEKQQQERSGR